MIDQAPGRSSKPWARAASAAFLLMVCLLPWMKHGFTLGGLEVVPSDLIFLVVMALWLAALAAGEMRLRFHPAFVLLALYFAAMAASLIVSADPRASAFKLLTQLYLLALPVMAFNFVETRAQAKKLILCWIAAATLVGAYGAATVLLFPLFGYDSFLREPLHNFGTLPPGFYPRIELTFEYPAMLANYLGVSLMLLLVAGAQGWVRRTTGAAAAGLMLLSAFFALTPGFGGILAMLFIWVWYRQRARHPRLAGFALLAAIGSIASEVLVAAVTPFLHPSAPFLIHVPGIATPLAPAVRLMVWTAAVHNFLASPLIGHGIGIDPVNVLFQPREGSKAFYVTDAHNLALGLAVQCGLLGLAALGAIVAVGIRQARAAAAQCQKNLLLFGLSIAWLSGLAIEGLVGSFEDARHLWVLFGLMLAAARLGGNARACGAQPLADGAAETSHSH
ncbi:MAG: O-antigen ligase family protein [Sphingomicrobium sp.]